MVPVLCLEIIHGCRENEKSVYGEDRLCICQHTWNRTDAGYLFSALCLLQVRCTISIFVCHFVMFITSTSVSRIILKSCRYTSTFHDKRTVDHQGSMPKTLHQELRQKQTSLHLIYSKRTEILLCSHLGNLLLFFFESHFQLFLLLPFCLHYNLHFVSYALHFFYSLLPQSLFFSCFVLISFRSQILYRLQLFFLVVLLAFFPFNDR